MIYTVPAERRLCCDRCGADGPMSSWELGVLELTLRADVDPGGIGSPSPEPPTTFHYCGTCAPFARAALLGLRTSFDPTAGDSEAKELGCA